MNAHTDSESSEHGLSIVELIIYIFIFGVIGILIMTLFINMWRTERTVTDQTGATTRGQLISSQIERAMRNAEAFTISGGGTILQVNTSLTGSLKCQAFEFTAGDAHMAVTDSPAPATDWPDWQDGVKQVGTTPFFAYSGTDGITYTFDATDPQLQGAPVRFTGDVHMRNSAAGTLAPCW